MSADLPIPESSAGARGSANTEAEPRAACNGSSGLVGAGGVRPYYDAEGVTIYCGDCREIVPRLGMFDLLLTDPPYGIGIAANPVRQRHAKSDWDAATPDAWVLPMLISKARASIIWGGNYFGLPAHQCFLAWDKMQPEDFSLAMLEQAWTNLKGPAKMFRKSVLSYAKEHPTQKPDELMQWCIMKAGEPQTILDPYAGSGTTGRAAKNLGKKCVLIEREERFCEIAAQRLSQSVLSLGGGGAEHGERNGAQRSGPSSPNHRICED
jgi:site-specific DNA-methyltransferase (adenine-specific)/modification methylase